MRLFTFRRVEGFSDRSRQAALRHQADTTRPWRPPFRPPARTHALRAPGRRTAAIFIFVSEDRMQKEPWKDYGAASSTTRVGDRDSGRATRPGHEDHLITEQVLHPACSHRQTDIQEPHEAVLRI